MAVDLACRSLKSGDIDLALAGGIAVHTHPGAFIAMNNAGMLSLSGQCRPFDQGADGIVVGDGVGILILKRLQDAVQDRDAVYGIIRAGGTNQDGQTSGITVPSFLAQSALQRSIYEKAGIHPQDIQYIEAHGTGTKLGDPIEVHALNHSFRHFTQEKGFCAMGSVKANIGHTEAAAGVMGLIKVLLSLKHGQMPPLVNFTRENEHIAFKDSPLYLNTALKPWPVNSRGIRLAAVSSFGFSGTNAHLVIEGQGKNNQASETVYGFDGAKEDGAEPLYLIVLSAATGERLGQVVKNLRHFILQTPPPHMADLAYTLQVGRDALAVRVAFWVKDIPELAERLEAYAEGEEKIKGCQKGRVGTLQQGMALLQEDEDARELIAKWISKGKLDRVAGVWVQGLEIDWNLLYGAVCPRRIHLPGYPFAGERHKTAWQGMVSQGMASGLKVPRGIPAPAGWRHPLVHENSSDIDGLRYTSTFTGKEFFLSDHLIDGQRVLPGVVYFEMAREAVELAIESRNRERSRIRESSWKEVPQIQLRNMVWASPVSMGSKREKPRSPRGAYRPFS